MNLKERLKNWYVNYTLLRWTVGVAEFDPDAILNPKGKLRIHWIKHHCKDRWFADPFILLMTDDYIFILVEEFLYSCNRGRISRLKVNRHTWKLEQIDPVIEQETHLSFPAYYREGGKVYIYPENTLSGKLTLFEYDEDSGIATKVRDLSDYPLADAVLWKLEGRDVILATTAPNDSGRKLDIYPYSSETDAAPVDSIAFKTKVARNAGVPFHAQGRTIRPAQDCTRFYGGCVVLQDMVVENGEVAFKEIRRLHSPLFKYGHAFHTFNVFEDKYVAVDAEGFRNGLPAQLLFFIREHFRK